MPFAGQPGSLSFDGANVSDFLEQWNQQAEAYGLTDSQKCTRLPGHCVSDLKLVIEGLDGFEERQWDTLEAAVKRTFRRYDKQAKSTAALDKLIADGPGTDLRLFLFKYRSITDALVKGGRLPVLDRITRLLDALPPYLDHAVAKLCRKKNWNLSDQDDGTVMPEFTDLLDFLLEKSSTDSYLRHTTHPSTPASVTAPVPVFAPAEPDEPALAPMPVEQRPIAIPRPLATRPTPGDDEMNGLLDKFSALSLFSSLRDEIRQISAAKPVPSAPTRVPSYSNQLPAPTNPVYAPVSSAFPPNANRPFRCLFCDSLDHEKRDCAELDEALLKGVVAINPRGQMIHPTTRELFPLSIGRGGVKASLYPATGSNAIPVGERNVSSVNMLTLEEPVASLGNSAPTYVIYADENGIITHDFANVEEKRRRESEPFTPRNVRPKPAPEPIPRPVVEIPAKLVPPKRLVPIPPFRDEIPLVVPAIPAGRSERYRLVSDISETHDLSSTVIKVLDTSVNLKLGELLAASPDLANSIVTKVKKRRQPVPGEALMNTLDIETPAPAFEVHVNSASLLSDSPQLPLYAAASPYVKCLVDGRTPTDALIDEGSEINIMSRWKWERTSLPIDTKIDWEIGSLGNVDRKKVLGVLHGIGVQVGGVEVPIHCFVMEGERPEMILGRPWKKTVRAKSDDRDDGSCWYTIYDIEGLKAAEFCAVLANHPRDRATCRNPITSTSGKE
jgi:Aspartyl protease